MPRGWRHKAHRFCAPLILLASLGSLLTGCTLRASGQDLVESVGDIEEGNAPITSIISGWKFEQIEEEE